MISAASFNQWMFLSYSDPVNPELLSFWSAKKKKKMQVPPVPQSLDIDLDYLIWGYQFTANETGIQTVGPLATISGNSKSLR